MKKKIMRECVVVRNDGNNFHMPLSKTTQIMSPKKFLYLDQLDDGTYRLIWSQGLAEKMSEIERLDIVRTEIDENPAHRD